MSVSAVMLALVMQPDVVMTTAAAADADSQSGQDQDPAKAGQ